MNKQISNKLNLLQNLLDEGLLGTTGWLQAQGYSRALLSRYVKSGWLVSPAHGVYRRPGPPLKWQHVVASLQLLGGSFLHIGGRTALVQRGLGHYVRMSGTETILLFGPEGLPAWVRKLGVKEHFAVRTDAMFGGLRVCRDENGTLLDFKGNKVDPGRLAEFGLQQMAWGAWDWWLIYSSNERAMFEVLQDVPSKESVYEADVLMQGLGTLRPAVVSTLLQACKSVKVKRLFLALAERHQHQWFSRLDLDNVDLGKGKRMLVPGGTLHPKYQITLPSDLDAHAG